MLFICYPKCSTCKKAQKYLDDHGVKYEYRDIVKDNPDIKEMMKWHKLSNLSLRKFFNTSGLLYRELNLKDKLDKMSDKQMYELLSSNGMLIKRPLLIDKDKILLGFKEKEYEEIFQ